MVQFRNKIVIIRHVLVMKFDGRKIRRNLRKLIAEGEYSLVPSVEQQKEEDHRQKLRQGQRQRAKEKKKAA